MNSKYKIIQSSIDGSNMAKNTKDIRDRLNEIRDNKLNKDNKENDELGNENDIDVYEECPACRHKVKQIEKICPECGLKLME